MNAKELLWTSGGLGRAPFAPGTFGTFGGVALAATALWLPVGGATIAYLSGLAVLVTLVGVWLGKAAEQHYGGKDPGSFVIDEVAGYLVAVVGHPLHARPLFVLGVAFLAFRITDILKPWPASLVDRKLKGGWGIMLDDVVAGVYANAMVWGALTLA